jgi:hypothetical protein
MICLKVRRLVLLHEKTERHYANYRELSQDLSAQSKALDHLRKAERLYRQISGIIRDINLAQALIGEEKSPGLQSSRSSQPTIPGHSR